MAAGWQIGIGETISKVVEEGFEVGGVQYGGLYRDGQMLTPDEANNRYSLPGLEFNEPVREGIAALKFRRKQEEIARNKVLELGGTGKLRKSVGMATMIVANNLSPIDFAFNFVPIAGMTKYGRAVNVWSKAAAKGKTSIKGFGAKAAMAVPGAKMAAFHRMVAASIDASVGNLILEIPLYFQNQRDQVRHTLGDVAFNVGFGGAFGAGLSGMGTVLRAASRKLAKSSNLAKMQAVRQTINELQADMPASGADLILEVDEAVARARTVAALETARADVAARAGDIEAQIRTKIETQGKLGDAPKSDIEAIAEEAIKRATKKNPQLAKIAARLLEASRTGDLTATHNLARLFYLDFNPNAKSAPAPFTSGDIDAKLKPKELQALDDIVYVLPKKTRKALAQINADRLDVDKMVEVEVEAARQEALKRAYNQAIDDMKAGAIEDPARKIIADIEAKRKQAKPSSPVDEVRGKAAEEAELREDIDSIRTAIEAESKGTVLEEPTPVDESGIRAGMNCAIKNAS